MRNRFILKSVNILVGFGVQNRIFQSFAQVGVENVGKWWEKRAIIGRKWGFWFAELGETCADYRPYAQVGVKSC